MSNQKRPSSLDYEGHLHELTLTNWRRAMLGDALDAARGHAERLADSPSRLWRALGSLHVGLTELGRGRSVDAIGAFERSAQTAGGIRGLEQQTRALAAHAHLAAGRAEAAIGVLGELSERDRRGLPGYFCALASLSRFGAQRAETIASQIRIAPLLDHLRFEIEGDLDGLRRAAGSLELRDPHGTLPAGLVHLRLGETLVERNELDEARAVFRDVALAEPVRLDWPVPAARALFRLGRVERRLGGHDRARLAFESFARRWADADLDPEHVKEAAQFSSA